MWLDCLVYLVDVENDDYLGYVRLLWYFWFSGFKWCFLEIWIVLVY